MKFEIHAPCEQLRPYIKHLIVSESDETQSYKVLPGTSLVMGFQYAGRLAYLDNNLENPLATAGITGLTDSYRVFKNTANTGSILVIFHETGAAHFFANPLNELFRQVYRSSICLVAMSWVIFQNSFPLPRMTGRGSGSSNNCSSII